MGYGLYVVSLVRRACWSPSSARCASIIADLIPASGYQDITTSPSATTPVVHRCPHGHRSPPQRIV